MPYGAAGTGFRRGTDGNAAFAASAAARDIGPIVEKHEGTARGRNGGQHPRPTVDGEHDAREERH